MRSGTRSVPPGFRKPPIPYPQTVFDRSVVLSLVGSAQAVQEIVDFLIQAEARSFGAQDFQIVQSLQARFFLVFRVFQNFEIIFDIAMDWVHIPAPLFMVRYSTS